MLPDIGTTSTGGEPFGKPFYNQLKYKQILSPTPSQGKRGGFMRRKGWFYDPKGQVLAYERAEKEKWKGKWLYLLHIFRG